MKLSAALSIGDVEKMARARLPRLLFETIESGVDDEEGLARNRAAFQHYRLMPHVLNDVAKVETGAKLLGQTYAAPIGISPTGIAGMFRRDAEILLAEAAAACRIPFVISGASMAAIEAVGRVSPHTTWFQVYPARERAITEDQVRRARDAGCAALVLTLDTPVLPNRERDKRNGAGLPFRPSLRLMLEALSHPAWLIDYYKHGGMPLMRSWAPYAPQGATPAQVAAFFRQQSPVAQTWRDLDRFRQMWAGPLILKGIAHPDDARRAIEMGIDGIWLSNHGGKALDRAIAPLEALPAVAAAVGRRVPIMLDSGIRRGSDIAIAHCLGADFTFVGRPTLYGVAASGTAGAVRAIEILQRELVTTMGLIGCSHVETLGRHYLAVDKASEFAPAARLHRDVANPVTRSAEVA